MDNTNKILNKDDIDIVLYHGSCSDGYGSAFIVWLYYKEKYDMDRVGKMEFIPCYYFKEALFDDKFIKKMTDKNILMCDFSYKYELLLQLINISKSFIILDHHKTAKADLQKLSEEFKIFDMNRSGVGITWDFFYPNKPIPKFLAYIQDRDLWTFKLPNTAEFIAYFYEQEFNFQLWESYLDNALVEKAIQTGTSWLEYQKIKVNEIIKRTSYIIQEYNNQYIIVLYCNSSSFKSEIGSQVLHKFPIGDFSFIWDFDLYRNQTYCSLRSTNERLDVSEIAKKYDGGGHHNASGITFSGCVPCLPLEKVADYNLLPILLDSIGGMVDIGSNKYSYTLLKVNDIHKEWLQDKYFDLIKRKALNSVLIVFETLSDSVDFNKEINEIIPLKEYHLFYNEKSIRNSEKKLPFLALVAHNHCLTFTSSKNFEEIFTDNPNKHLEEHDEYSDLSEDELSDESEDEI